MNNKELLDGVIYTMLNKYQFNNALHGIVRYYNTGSAASITRDNNARESMKMLSREDIDAVIGHSYGNLIDYSLSNYIGGLLQNTAVQEGAHSRSVDNYRAFERIILGIYNQEGPRALDDIRYRLAASIRLNDISVFDRRFKTNLAKIVNSGEALWNLIAGDNDMCFLDEYCEGVPANIIEEHLQSIKC